MTKRRKCLNKLKTVQQQQNNPPNQSLKVRNRLKHLQPLQHLLLVLHLQPLDHPLGHLVKPQFMVLTDLMVLHNRDLLMVLQ